MLDTRYYNKAQPNTGEKAEEDTLVIEEKPKASKK
jgi:hypothetical protein